MLMFAHYDTVISEDKFKYFFYPCLATSQHQGLRVKISTGVDTIVRVRIFPIVSTILMCTHFIC